MPKPNTKFRICEKVRVIRTGRVVEIMGFKKDLRTYLCKDGQCIFEADEKSLASNGKES